MSVKLIDVPCVPRSAVNSHLVVQNNNVQSLDGTAAVLNMNNQSGLAFNLPVCEDVTLIDQIIYFAKTNPVTTAAIVVGLYMILKK